jgi:hypothetical protein
MGHGPCGAGTPVPQIIIVMLLAPNQRSSQRLGAAHGDARKRSNQIDLFAAMESALSGWKHRTQNLLVAAPSRFVLS